MMLDLLVPFLSICTATSSENAFVEPAGGSEEQLGFALGVNGLETHHQDGLLAVATGAKTLDLRVVKAYGSRGYDKLRISVVTTSATNDTNNGLFTYAHPFRYRWTQLFLRSGTIHVFCIRFDRACFFPRMLVESSPSG